jgi:ATP-binding cassette subfamily B protein
MRSQAKNLYELCWPAERLSEAAAWLARANGLAPARALHTSPALGREWLENLHITAAAQGFEIEPVSSPFSGLDVFFQNAAPALIPMPIQQEGDAPVFLVLTPHSRRCAVLTPELRKVSFRASEIADAFREPLSAQYLEPAGHLVGLADLTPERRQKAVRALIGTWLGAEILPMGWMLRASPGANFVTQVRQSRIVPEVLSWLATYALQDLLFLLGWWLIGRVVLDGQTDAGWVWAWALLLVSVIPFQLASGWAQNQFSQALSVLFKQRLLFGALKLNPDSIRHMGTGQMLERVNESDALESLALGGGLSALISVFQLGVAAAVLSQGVSAALSVGALTLWTLAMLGAGWVNYRSKKQYIDSYRAMTNGMVEKMVGHRTRLAQEDPAHRHDEEDSELDQYMALTRGAAWSTNLLNAIPSSWLVAGLACLVPALAANDELLLAKVAVSLGGVMLANQAFNVIQSGIQNDIQLLLSWEQVKPIYQAGGKAETAPSVLLESSAEPTASLPAAAPEPGARRAPLITARNLTYRFQPHRRPALNDCSLDIYSGDRILLEGPSGGGKTTLAAVLAGLRKPDSGILFLKGYDWQSLGETAWHNHVVMAPQFHENHIFNESFAFNLLMGRRWPPQPEDLQEAEDVCRELGLGELLARMPSGWQQMVGESGWQLSHGERSRVFIARALLQNADMVIMDESFGALDPENLHLAMACAQHRAKTLLIIAHP